MEQKNIFISIIKMVRYVFTFGFSQKNLGRYVIIKGKNKENCRDRMIARFGMKWANQYEFWKLDRIKAAGLKELK